MKLTRLTALFSAIILSSVPVLSSAQTYRPFRHSDMVTSSAPESQQVQQQSVPATSSSTFNPTSHKQGLFPTSGSSLFGSSQRSGISSGNSANDFDNSNFYGINKGRNGETYSGDALAVEPYSYSQDVASASSRRPRRSSSYYYDNGNQIPANPEVGDTYTINGVTYTYDGSKWVNEDGTESFTSEALGTAGNVMPVGEPYILLLFAVLSAGGLYIRRRKTLIAGVEE